MNLATGRSASSSHLQVSLSHRVSPFGSSHLQRIRFPLLTEQTPPCDTSRQRLSERVSVCLPSMMAMQITYVRVNSRHVPLVPLITAAARTIPHSSLPCIVENMQKDLGQNDKPPKSGDLQTGLLWLDQSQIDNTYAADLRRSRTKTMKTTFSSPGKVIKPTGR